MENQIVFKYKMLGIVTLYNPNVKEAIENITCYAPWLDALIIWDNSPIEHKDKQQMMPFMSDIKEKIIWYGTGENLCIAQAINFAWQYAQENHYDSLLIMDQDSKWDDFALYRKKVEDFNNVSFSVCTPYIKNWDSWPITQEIQSRNVFINSGTVVPIQILSAIGGADENFPLDALDTDLSYRVKLAGYEIVCMTQCKLNHTMGTPKKLRWLPISANNYRIHRLYNIVYSQVLCTYKHRNWLKRKEKWCIIKELIIKNIIRIVLLEDNKVKKIMSIIKGVKAGIQKGKLLYS